MSSVHNSVETVNAAATAIVTAESRVQPSTVQKRRWGSCWSIYWCFGSNKHNKRIGHAVIVSEPAGSGVVAPISESRSHPSTIVLPFIAPPSSPASFLQSDPPSATQSPAGLLSLASLSVHAQSTGGSAPMFTIGPYAHETQLVSPPVFSTFTTEPSTACFTPPPESVQMTTPSSPEVPFAQLLSSSLARNRRNSGANLKYNLSQYEFQPYQYPGSPGGHLKSPGSAMSTSGTSSPFPDKRPIMEFRMGEAPKFLGYEHFPNYKWDSRVGSGSLTPNGWGSRLGSGALTPNGGEPPSRDGKLVENQIYEVASLANSDHKSQNDDLVVDHRVSFELFGEDVPTCIVREPAPSHRNMSVDPQEARADRTNKKDSESKNADGCREQLHRDTANEAPGMPSEGDGEEFHQKHRTISLGSSKEFNFNNAKEEVSEKSSVDCEWWTNEEVVRKELGPRNSWSFFPMLQSGAS
ncbi:hydroxyproline-rich glycoprotein family protein [Perilla frutescens var. frutescens]|nr:hydroxyproline-rich glycoprotein family protein [Perilla frutescens var. frutescens]